MQQQQAVARIEAAFAEQGGDPTEPAPADSASLEDVLAALAPDEAMIEYAIASTPLHPAAQVWACLLTAGHARLLRLRVDDDDVPGAGFIEPDQRRRPRSR